MPAWKPRSRAAPVEASCGPAMCPILVCPSAARCATAARTPCSLSTETEENGKSGEVRFISTTGTSAAAASARIGLPAVAVPSTNPSTCLARIWSKTSRSLARSASVLPSRAT